MAEPPHQPSHPDSGTHVHAGTNAGVFAVGSNARATQLNQGADVPDVLARLEIAVQQLTATAAAELDSGQADQVAGDADRVIEEARRGRPDWDRITALLGRITARAGAVPALLQTVDRVKDLVEALPH
jgi:hypothetical protein